METGGQPCGADPVVAFYRRALPHVYGGKQIMIEGTAGNPIALSEPARPEARLT